MGRTEEAVSEMKRAQQLDPLSAEITSYVGLSYYWARKYSLAIEQLQESLEIDPNFWLPHLLLGWTHLQEDKFPQAIAEIQKAHQLDDNPWPIADLAYAFAVSEKKNEAQKILNDLNELSKRRYVSPYFIARIQVGLGQKEEAFLWLQKAYENRDESLTWLKVDPLMDSLRSDSRYADLLRGLGLVF